MRQTSYDPLNNYGDKASSDKPNQGPLLPRQVLNASGQRLSNPYLIRPTIPDFALANHNHENATGGGVLTQDALDIPYVSCLRTTNQTIATGTVTAVSFDSESFIGGTQALHSTSTNPTRFTASVAGLYAIWGHATFAANATGRRAVNIMVNGTATDWSALIANAGAATVACNTYEEYYLNANEYVEFGVWQDSGGNLDVVANRVKAGFRRVA